MSRSILIVMIPITQWRRCLSPRSIRMIPPSPSISASLVMMCILLNAKLVCNDPKLASLVVGLSCLTGCLSSLAVCYPFSMASSFGPAVGNVGLEEGIAGGGGGLVGAVWGDVEVGIH